MSNRVHTMTKQSPTLLLASASPRRKALLASLGVAFETRSLDADEQFSERWDPESVARTLAERKLGCVYDSSEWDYVLTADTIVCAPVADGERILGKPRDAEQASEYLTLLSGRAHRVLTGVSLSGRAVGGVETAISQTIVHVAHLSESEVAWYVSLEEWRDAAGGYRMQDAGAAFVERIEGSASNVIGLPMRLVYSMLLTHRYPFR